MTEVQFHFNVPDRLLYACRLLRKALRSGASGVAGCAPTATRTPQDRTMWAIGTQGFNTHLLVRENQPVPQRLQRTPIWLVERAEQGGRHPVLVHLGDEPAQGFESFSRLIEIVSTDPEERDAARARWRHYAGRGYELQRFDVGAS